MQLPEGRGYSVYPPDDLASLNVSKLVVETLSSQGEAMLRLLLITIHNPEVSGYVHKELQRFDFLSWNDPKGSGQGTYTQSPSKLAEIFAGWNDWDFESKILSDWLISEDVSNSDKVVSLTDPSFPKIFGRQFNLESLWRLLDLDWNLIPIADAG